MKGRGFKSHLGLSFSEFVFLRAFPISKIPKLLVSPPPPHPHPQTSKGQLTKRDAGGVTGGVSDCSIDAGVNSIKLLQV